MPVAEHRVDLTRAHDGGRRRALHLLVTFTPQLSHDFCIWLGWAYTVAQQDAALRYILHVRVEELASKDKAGKNYLGGGTAGWLEVLYKRVVYAEELLRSLSEDELLLFSDLDVVPLRPYSLLEPALLLRPPTPTPARPSPSVFFMRNNPARPHELHPTEPLNAGFWVAHSTAASKTYLMEWRELLESNRRQRLQGPWDSEDDRIKCRPSTCGESQAEPCEPCFPCWRWCHLDGPGNSSLSDQPTANEAAVRFERRHGFKVADLLPVHRASQYPNMGVGVGTGPVVYHAIKAEQVFNALLDATYKAHPDEARDLCEAVPECRHTTHRGTSAKLARGGASTEVSRRGAKQDGVLPTPYHIPGGFKNPSTASRRFLLERAHNQSLGLPVSARGWIAAGGFGGTMCRAFTGARALPVDGLDITAMATREGLLRTAFAASSLWGGNSSSRRKYRGPPPPR